MDENFPEFIDQPIDGTLDLHIFSPKEVKTLIHDYIEACLQRGITKLRIIHGKGAGTLRAIVRSILEKHPKVSAFWQEEGSGGSWGATIVDLRKD